MQQYREKLKAEGKETSEGSRVIECDSWEELAALAQEAEGDYIQQGGSVVRRLSRAFGDYTSALHALAGLLPTESNFSMMSGGVRLLLRVSARKGACLQLLT